MKLLILISSSFLLVSCYPITRAVRDSGFLWLVGLIGLIAMVFLFRYCQSRKDKEEYDRCDIYTYTIILLLGSGSVFLILADLLGKY